LHNVLHHHGKDSGGVTLAPERSAPTQAAIRRGPRLFEPLTIRGVTARNRIWVSPMCQYSSDDGAPTDWHLVHLGSRAAGGAGLVMVEATAVEARGRISPWDSGIWSDRHVEPFARIARFVREQGAVPAMQLAHAGRKASVKRPWEGGGPLAPHEGAWETVAPSAIPFADSWPTPRALELQDIGEVVSAFRGAASRALVAEFEAIEIHGAHGYLLHEFLSPFSNQRTDQYGGSFENRIRVHLEVADAVRAVWPERLPLFWRLSCTEWTEGGWDLEETIELSRLLAQRGVDLIDCSSGGNVATASIPLRPAYQTRFAEGVRQATGLLTGAVGLISSPELAEEIVANGRADVVLMARELLRDPYWPLHAAKALAAEIGWPTQYLRAKS
jgi:2,4-dienoyl-CoA reductase-like NADH-dependent reductase (Old Yellow Enzyme family)